MINSNPLAIQDVLYGKHLHTFNQGFSKTFDQHLFYDFLILLNPAFLKNIKCCQANFLGSPYKTAKSRIEFGSFFVILEIHKTKCYSKWLVKPV